MSSKIKANKSGRAPHRGQYIRSYFIGMQAPWRTQHGPKEPYRDHISADSSLPVCIPGAFTSD